jgi:hypothetical protein
MSSSWAYGNKEVVLIMEHKKSYFHRYASYDIHNSKFEV